ncbi:uncharacterized protein METZ01_LOCUS247342 [marine metagenome]|uniref:Uncharacterized protein n=1 Tax=marine metagenome TaxID=408172 RepID=A0A382I4M1_9ZZZZ
MIVHHNKDVIAWRTLQLPYRLLFCQQEQY